MASDRKILSRKNIDMTEGIVWKQLLLFALPLILGDCLQQLYNTTDSIIVGQFVGKTGLAAVSSTESIINTIIGLFSGISAGSTIVLARYFGAKDEEKIYDTVQTTIAIALLMGVIMMAAGLIFSPALLRFLKTPDDVLPEAKQYLSIYFCGMMGLVIYNMCGGLLRAVGDSLRPLIALIITSVLNIGLDLLLVAVLKMGVAGAAWATIIAIYVSAAYLLFLLIRSKTSCRYDPRHMKIDLEITRKVLQIGVPMGLQKSIIAFSNTFIISHINYFGSAASAGWGVYRKVDQLVMNVNNNLGQAISTFVSQNLGADKMDRVKSGSRFGIIFTTVACFVLDMLLLVLRTPITRLFNSDPEVLYYAAQAFIYSLPFQVMNGLNSALTGKIRGFGDSRGPVILTLLSVVVFRQIYLNVGWTMVKTFSFVVLCYPVAWTFNIIALLIYYKKKKYA